MAILSAVHYINDKKQKVIEGELRCGELSEYLKYHEAPRRIWLSEDATGIVSKVEYDSTANELVGLLLPIHEMTGMPNAHSFMARSANEIAVHMGNPLSSLIYIVMAQSLKENVPPFTLLMYGTDNKFKTNSVLHRWKFIEQELKKYI